jgi:hypothetical protein
MSTKFFRFDSQAQYEELKQFFTNENTIDEIGEIFFRNGGTTEDPIFAKMVGWHVNAQGPIPQELVAFLVFPVAHNREFFGVPNCKTVTYLGEIDGAICVELEGVVYAFN